MPERIVHSDNYSGQDYVIVELYDESREHGYPAHTYIGGYDALIAGIKWTLEGRAIPDCITETKKIIDRTNANR